MTKIFQVVFSLSLSGSLVALILFLLHKLLKERFTKTWQYYIWLVVIFRLLIPLTPPTNLMKAVFDQVNGPSTTIIQPETVYEETIIESVTEDNPTTVQEEAAQSLPSPGLLEELAGYLWPVWLGVGTMLMVRKITSYNSFLHYVKAGIHQVRDEKVLALYREECRRAGIGREIPLYTNELVATPLLAGIFRPFIVLPDLSVEETSLRNILRHELTHYKRGDIFYKWLTQLTVCLHWFNPVVYLVSREINRNCEFSCDEMVIRRMDEEEQYEYGDTLLDSLQANGRYVSRVTSITLNEDVQLLKERLGAIMNFKERPKLMMGLTVGITVLIVFAAAFTGAYAGTSTANSHEGRSLLDILTGTRTHTYAIYGEPVVEEEADEDGARTLFTIYNASDTQVTKSGSFEAKNGQILGISVDTNISGGSVDFFLFSPRGDEQHFTFTQSATHEIALTEGFWAYNCTGFFDEGNFVLRADILETGMELSANTGAEKEIQGIGIDPSSSLAPESTGNSQASGTASAPSVPANTQNSSQVNHEYGELAGQGNVPAALTGKSIPESAKHVLYYSRQWSMVELMLPNMTTAEMDEIVGIYNTYIDWYQINDTKKKASDYYGLSNTDPSVKDADDRAGQIMNLSGNFGYVQPLFPYMTNEGIGRVVDEYNQKTGSRLEPSDYYN